MNKTSPLPCWETIVAVALAKDALSKSLAGRSGLRPLLSALLILAPIEEIWSEKVLLSGGKEVFRLSVLFMDDECQEARMVRKRGLGNDDGALAPFKPGGSYINISQSHSAQLR